MLNFIESDNLHLTHHERIVSLSNEPTLDLGYFCGLASCSNDRRLFYRHGDHVFSAVYDKIGGDPHRDRHNANSIFYHSVCVFKWKWSEHRFNIIGYSSSLSHVVKALFPAHFIESLFLCHYCHHHMLLWTDD